MGVLKELIEKQMREQQQQVAVTSAVSLKDTRKAVIREYHAKGNYSMYDIPNDPRCKMVTMNDYLDIIDLIVVVGYEDEGLTTEQAERLVKRDKIRIKEHNLHSTLVTVEDGQSAYRIGGEVSVVA